MWFCFYVSKSTLIAGIEVFGGMELLVLDIQYVQCLKNFLKSVLFLYYSDYPLILFDCQLLSGLPRF